jgi:hypothetical protein
VLCDLLHVSLLLSFISLLCHPFPLLHYQNTNLSVSFLVLLPATVEWLPSKHKTLSSTPSTANKKKNKPKLYPSHRRRGSKNSNRTMLPIWLFLEGYLACCMDGGLKKTWLSWGQDFRTFMSSASVQICSSPEQKLLRNVKGLCLIFSSSEPLLLIYSRILGTGQVLREGVWLKPQSETRTKTSQFSSHLALHRGCSGFA